MNDPYLDPDTGILRNTVGATSQDELDAAETYITTIRDASIAVNPIPGSYDLAHLQQFHRQLFGDIYDWAGTIRSVAISKPGTQFCLPQFIESSAAGELDPMMKQLDYLRGLPFRDTVLGLADLLAEINMLHPFRDGNGRTQRAFLRQMTAAAGWTLHWEGLDAKENIEASRASTTGNLEPLITLLTPRLTPLTHPH